jgi:hypothetical protein
VASVVIGLTFLVLVALGVPIGTCLGAAAVVTLFVFDLGMAMVGMNFCAGIASFPLLAIPFFVLAAAIVIITSTAKFVGPGWAGLFSAFPITMLPLVVIIHFTYGPKHVYSILKNVPRGLGSLVIYSLAVFFFYPSYGIYVGTVMAYALATIYLIVVQFIMRRQETEDRRQETEERR